MTSNNGLVLRPYQIEAVERAVGRGNLLFALTMGSGKTAAACRTVQDLRDAGEATSGTVLALNSIKFQWLREIAKWDPGALAQVVDGDKRQRTLQIRHSDRFHYTVMHYECLVNDWELIRKYLTIDFIIADEITAIKSFTAKRSRRLKAMRNYTPYRFGLSGQPVENKPEELFSIMEFLDPNVLGSFDRFDRTFIERDHWGKPKRYKNLPTLQKIMAPAMIRKSRADIAQWLPTLVEMELPVELDHYAMDLHDYVKEDLLEAIDQAMAAGSVSGFDLLVAYGRTPHHERASMKGEVMARLLAMRMLASHPALLNWSADNFDTPDSRHGSRYASHLKKTGKLPAGPPARHAKLDALLEVLGEILSEDPAHKVVVFSYFKPMLAFIGSELTKRKIPFTTVTGDIKTRDRDDRIVRFNTDPHCRVFLSSDAGAYGIDLHQGSHLINYDLPWSAGILQQRVSRIDRTASGWPSIMVMYMYGLNTIEERMYNMLRQKMAVAGAFLDGQYDTKTGSLPLSLGSLREFLTEL